MIKVLMEKQLIDIINKRGRKDYLAFDCCLVFDRYTVWFSGYGNEPTLIGNDIVVGMGVHGYPDDKFVTVLVCENKAGTFTIPNLPHRGILFRELTDTDKHRVLTMAKTIQSEY